MAAGRSNSTYLEQALELLESARATGDSRILRDIDAFRRRSADHAQALERAETFLDSLPDVSTTEPSGGERLQLGMQVLWARLLERPQLLGAAAAAMIGVGLAAALIPTDKESPAVSMPAQIPMTPQAQRFESGRERAREILLEDGSSIWLDWNSSLVVRLAPELRSIELTRGQAAFSVAKDPARPLEVTARGVTTTVTGTEFVVSLRHTELVDVAVLEGSVTVATEAGSAVPLTAGEAIQGTDRSLFEPTTRPLESVGTWRDGVVVVRNQTLTEAIDMLAPYTSFELDVSGMTSPGPRISATFFVERADDALVDLIETHRLRYRQSPPNLLRLRDPLPSRPN
ncbi:MAG: FecR domain-containing protein [Pseudomonadota bacterium]